MRDARAGSDPLVSLFADDPDMASVVEFFVNELDDRADEVEAAERAWNLVLLEKLAHELKAAARGYGFPAIGEAADEVESGIHDAVSRPAMRERVGALTDLCRRAQA